MTTRAHADAVRTLRAWVAPTAAQEELRAAYLDHLRDHPDATQRSGPPSHLTASVLVLDPSGSRVLLTHHRKADAWFQFGGHIDAADDGLRAAAIRELREESGLTEVTVSLEPCHLDRHELRGAFGRCREHLDVRFVAVAPADAVPVCSGESHAVRWFELDALPAGAADDLGELIDLARRQLADVTP